MWHQPWSSSSVSTTMSARAPAGDRPLTVITAVDRPASRATRSAALVAPVAPSCETPMTRPRAGGASDSSNACSALTVAPGSPTSPAASRRISAAASAPCSEVPQPVMMTGSPAASVARMASARSDAEPAAAESRPSSRRARAGSAAIISVMWIRRPGRRWGRGVVPRLGWSGERGGRIEGGFGGHGRLLRRGSEDRRRRTVRVERRVPRDTALATPGRHHWMPVAGQVPWRHVSGSGACRSG